MMSMIRRCGMHTIFEILRHQDDLVEVTIPKYKSAVDDINTPLNIMTEYGQTLMAQDIVEGRIELKAEAQRLGQRMRNLIEDNLEHLLYKRKLMMDALEKHQRLETDITAKVIIEQGNLDGVGASDGIELAVGTRSIALDTVIIGKLEPWLEKPADLPYALWIQAPFESGTESSSRSAAIRFVQMLIEARALFICCICWRPNKSETPDFEGTEGEAGILAMVYSPTLHLLKFKPPGREQIELNEHEITTLDGNITHWKTALGIFATLLKGTPNLRCCSISDLNAFEYDALHKCKEFLDVLLSQTEPLPPQIYLTTSGYSQLLDAYADLVDHVVTQLTYNGMKRRGMISQFSEWYDPQSLSADTST
ncbi:hypothetical protein ZTR_10281 [Talaromyces verruculosus]|nr:hypothetical protein ZTR_10281 [Talaromyces verruculosus]